jgi:segregation and condensation protein B
VSERDQRPGVVEEGREPEPAPSGDSAKEPAEEPVEPAGERLVEFADEPVVEPVADADPPSVVLTDKPSTEPVTSESPNSASSTSEPSTDERATTERAGAGNAADERADEQPSPSGSESPASEPLQAETSSDERPTDELTPDEPSTAESATTESTTGEPAAETPAIVDGPSDDTAEQPADADPPTELLDVPPADAVQDADEPAELTDTELDSTLEALLLVVDSPVDEESLAAATDTTVARVNAALLRLAATYTEHDRGLDLRNTGGGWRYYTRDRYAPYVEKLLLGGQRAKLTRAALETLAVIAYRQPVTRARVAAVRGVNCDGVIRTLLARGLVEETGTDLETGGFLYRTTELFLERLGLSSLEDLPPIAPLLPEVDSIDDV